MNLIRRRQMEKIPWNLPIEEWQNRLALVPKNVVEKTLLATTQYYMTLEAENRQDSIRHMQSRCPGLIMPRQNELVASDTLFPSVPTSEGHTCSQFFVGTKSDYLEIYPMKRESQNGEALQDFTRQ